MKITEWVETNPCYNPDSAGNGGGYSQPYIVVELDDGKTFVIEDTSCGDYGTRIMASYNDGAPIEEQRWAYFGTMLDEGQENSCFTVDDIPMLDEIHELTGYYIPTKDEI